MRVEVFCQQMGVVMIKFGSDLSSSAHVDNKIEYLNSW